MRAMKQLKLGFEANTTAEPKHYNQGRTKHCALYALATLSGLEPNHIIATAKAELRGTRTRYNGRFWQIKRVYNRLGYHFPASLMKAPGRKVKDTDLSLLEGRGMLRMRKRKNSSRGHHVTFCNGIIYDSGENRPYAAGPYLRASIFSGWHYINIIPEEALKRIAQ